MIPINSQTNSSPASQPTPPLVPQPLVQPMTQVPAATIIPEQPPISTPLDPPINHQATSSSPAPPTTASDRTGLTESPLPPVATPMKQRLQDLVNEVDPDEQLDEDVEEILLDIADEFIENVVSSSCAIAKHRNSNSLEVEDVKLYLERKYKIWIPGFGESKPIAKKFSSEAHKQRMALINKQDNRSGDDANKSQKSK